MSSGLLDRVRDSLKATRIDFVELGGVQPNPRISLVREGINLCREEHITFILAVGGGSVIDSAKAIAVGVPYQGDVWDFYDHVVAPERALGVGVILTIPAAGSESSNGSVISNEEFQLKRGLTANCLQPRFALMNPELTFTLPPYQTACGTVDIMAHVMERYFTNTQHVELTDRLCESVLKTIIANVPVVLREPKNYDARAEIMWAGTIAHNNLLGTGREEDWSSHAIEHEISAIYDVAHGAGLAVVFPAWMKYVFGNNVARFARFAVNVWDVEPDFSNLDKTAQKGIGRMEEFFSSIGLPVRFPELNAPGKIDEIALKCVQNGNGTIGNFMKLDQRAIREILLLTK